MPYGEGNPQLEDGYSRVANEILDALAMTSLSDHESRCIHFLWRKTYGFRNPKTGDSKKEDIIAYSQWANGTGIDKRSVRRALDNLVHRHIINKKMVKVPGKNPLTIWSFQKNYQNWNGYKPVYQLQLGSGEPPLETIVGSEYPPLTEQVGSPAPPPSYEVGTDLNKVGSPAPPQVGSPAPPTIDNKDNTKDKQQQQGNEKEENILKIMKTFKGWEFNHDEDLEWLKGFLEDYPTADVLTIKACADFNSEKPEKKGPWKNRMRQWMKHELTKKSGGNSYGTHKGKPEKFTKEQYKASLG